LSIIFSQAESYAQTKYYNQKHKFKFFNVNNLIMLSAKKLKQKKLSKKLLNKMLKLFYIQEFINKQMYHLNLSIIYKMIDNKIHLYVMLIMNLLILFCVRIEVRRVKRFQFNAVQIMLERCIIRKVIV